MYSQNHAALSATIARGACELWCQNIRLSMRLLCPITVRAMSSAISRKVDFLVIGVFPLPALSLWFDWSMDAIKAIMIGKHHNLWAASKSILPANAKTDSISGDKFERHGWPDLPALSSADSYQCCAIKTSFDSKAKRWKNWWNGSFAPCLSQRNTRKIDRSRIGKRLSFNWRAAAASKNCQIYQLD